MKEGTGEDFKGRGLGPMGCQNPLEVLPTMCFCRQYPTVDTNENKIQSESGYLHYELQDQKVRLSVCLSPSRNE